VASSIPDEVIGFFNWSNPFSRTMALGSTQPLIEMSTRNLPGNKGWLTMADKLTAISEPILYKMWEPRSPTILWASTGCYRESFTFSYLYIKQEYRTRGNGWYLVYITNTHCICLHEWNICRILGVLKLFHFMNRTVDSTWPYMTRKYIQISVDYFIIK
jgi:hypothetical protein